ncbi:MAG: hypothetical protein IT452_21500 [Planctomycetia bacterium]|nr:hypothetical protein [Planctomycetia bacterium]
MIDPLGPNGWWHWVSVYHLAEIGILAALIVLVSAVGGSALRKVHRGFDALASRPTLALCSVGLLSLVGSAVVAVTLGMPEASLHDEFSYLLAADTFSSGRLTNPTHPHWPFFETFHVIHTPSYQSKYMPGQGLVLAFGQSVAGDPIVGVWLCTAAACGALTWMLQGWVPPRWALVGGLLAALRMGIVGSWAQSYWGGSLAVLGGALVYGALPRLLRRPALPASLAMAAGFACLVNSRPFEGAIACLPAAAALLPRFARGGVGASPARWLLVVAVPLAAGLAATLAWIGIYNAAVTGSATRLPYFAHQERYARISQFLWGTPPPRPEYRHEAMRAFYEDDEKPVFDRQRRPLRFVAEGAWKLLKVNDTPLGVLAWLALGCAPWLVRRRRHRVPLAAFGLVWLTMAGLTIALSHYTAPATACGFLAIVLGLRHASVLRLRRFRLRGAAAAVLAVAALLVVYHAKGRGESADPFGRVKAHYTERLQETAGDHVVFVRYGPRHITHNEWVYNGADIDRQRVVWARDMGATRNRDLLGYYPGRTAWLMSIDRDEDPPDLRPYPR